MVRADQDRPRTAPDPTVQPIDIGAGGHHGEEVVGCACGEGAVPQGPGTLFSGPSRGVDVGVAECVQGQMPMMWVSIPVVIWLAAVSQLAGVPGSRRGTDHRRPVGVGVGDGIEDLARGTLRLSVGTGRVVDASWGGWLAANLLRLLQRHRQPRRRDGLFDAERPVPRGTVHRVLPTPDSQAADRDCTASSRGPLLTSRSYGDRWHQGHLAGEDQPVVAELAPTRGVDFHHGLQSFVCALACIDGLEVPAGVVGVPESLSGAQPGTLLVVDPC